MRENKKTYESERNTNRQKIVAQKNTKNPSVEKKRNRLIQF